MKVRLGKVMLTPAGEYSSSKTYSRLDIVVKDDCAYVSLTDNNANHPLTDENYWMLLLDGSFTRRYYEQNGITVASIVCNGNATIGGNLTISGSIISPDLQARLNTLNGYINNNTNRINALNTRMTTAENNIANLYNGGGGGGGGGIDPATLAQLRSDINSKVDISYFNRLFQAYNGTAPVYPNDGTTNINNIKALYDFWSAGSVTALGYNSGGSGGGGGGAEYLSDLSDVSLSSPSDGQALVWDATNSRWKNGSAVPDLTGYATQSWVTSNHYTKTETNNAISEAISQSSGFDPTKYYLKTETYSQSEITTMLGGYLPTSGGTVTGNLTVSGNVLHLGQYTNLENYNGAKFALPNKGVNTNWTIATTDDIPDISTLVSSSYFDRLFVALDSNGDEILPNDTTTPIASIKARYDFWSTGAISAYGTSSGQNSNLGALLTSLNNSGLAAPTSSEIGKAIVWTSNGWAYDTATGGGGITLSDVRSELQSTTPAYKINAARIPDLSSTYLTTTAAANTYLTQTDAASTYLTRSEAGRYVTIETDQTISGAKTFSSAAAFSNSIFLNKTNGQQFISFSNGTYEGTYGQDTSGNLYIYSQNPINWYTSINGHYGLYQLGSSGYVGVNNNNPQYNLDVTGTIRATDSVIIGGGKIAWDSTNNSLYVQGADGSVCHLYSLGGISALGVGTGSGASISSLRVTTLNAGTVNASTKVVTEHLNYGSDPLYIDVPNSDYYVSFNYQQDYYDSIMCYMTDFYNVGLFGEDDNANETWRIMPNGVATFEQLNASTVKGTYIMMGNLARLRANGSTVYLETRATSSSDWVIKETWS